jgi:transposase
MITGTDDHDPPECMITIDRIERSRSNGIRDHDRPERARCSFFVENAAILKALLWDGQGLVLYAKRLERGRFVWPQAQSGTVTLTNAQLSMLLEGIDWRMPAWTARPGVAA